MKYVYLNFIALIGFILTYFIFKYGYFLDINNFVANVPRSNFLVWLFFIITDVGSLLTVSFISIFLVAVLTIQSKYKNLLYTTIAILGGLASQSIIKNILMVGRPENSPLSSWGYSFPSGHTNMVTIVFLCFCFYVFNDFVDMRKRRFYTLVSILIIFVVGLSRLYLNAHWVSDVVAGWCLGLFWATAPLAFENFVLFKHKFLNRIKFY
jgi:undecaprenyl-diphosphatase